MTVRLPNRNQRMSWFMSDHEFERGSAQMKLRFRSRSFSGLLLTGALAAASCVGRVGPPTPVSTNGQGANPATGSGGNSGTGATTPSGSGSSAGTGSGSGTGAVPGTGSGPSVTQPGTGGSPVVSGPRDPGRVTMRQLNRVEYNNTVRDLLGTAQQPASAFLSDTPAFAFDNNGDLLSISPVLAGLYEQAAEALAAEAITAPFKAKLLTCDLTAAGDTCQRTFINAFGAKAYRRPLTATEVTGYVGLMASAKTAGATTDEVLRTAIEAFLQSPNFLYRIEFDPSPTSAAVHPVAPYEMASRLSYLIFRSMPDQGLFDAAAAGKLGTPADVLTQLNRMLADPKGSTFAQDFSAQWLGVRSLEAIQFDPTVFPKFTPALAASMKAEITSFFDDFIKENLPADQLLTAKFSYIDNTLATHYGLPAVGAGGVKKTTLASPQRGGLLTMAGTLAATSYMTRTSLVKRGAYVEGQMLCSEPPPPPNDVPPFPTGMLMGTQREILVMHRKNISCGACHVVMDNIGIALENYDGTGAWRTADANGAVIDANGELGTPPVSFNGGQQLAAVLAQDPRFVPCVSKKMLAYALGRALVDSDDPYVADIAAPSSTGAPGVRDILTRVVASDTFNMRHGEP